MHEHDNLKGTRGEDRDSIPRTLSSKTIVIVSGTAAKLEPLRTIKDSHYSGNKRTSSSSEQSDTYQRKKTFIYY